MKVIVFIALIYLTTQFMTPKENVDNDTLIKLYRAYKAQYANEFKIKDEESDERFHIFKSNQELMVVSNNHKENTHTVGLTPFSHLTNDEFRGFQTGLKPKSIEATQLEFNNLRMIDLPDSVDWRKTGVTKVKNQEQCGSCWAFSAIETLESREHIVAKKPLVALSAQELVDCEHIQQDNGCSGGLPEHAFTWIKENGIASAADYGSYKAKAGTCKSKSVKPTFNNVSGFVQVKANIDALATAVAIAPVSIGVAAGGSTWQSYNGGIVKNGFIFGCKTTPLDHGVSVVGYTAKYWIVRNSWGASWGNAGYIQLERKAGENTCGLLTDATYPTFK